MQQTHTHGGHEATRRTDGDLFHKINDTLAQLELVPLADRNELWAAAWGGATHASNLLAEGFRAKAGKVLVKARLIADPEYARKVDQKRVFGKAFRDLEKRGVPVYKHVDDRGNFSISAEEESSGEWVNYWASGVPGWDCGVSDRLTKILDKHGLYAEWVNPGRLAVYEA